MIRCKIYLKDIGNTCPVCGQADLDASMDDHRDGEYQDTYQCGNCGLVVTYVTKDNDIRQYHEYRDGEIEVQLELFTSGFETNQAQVFEMLDDIIEQEEEAENDGCYRFMIDLVARAKVLKAALNTDNPSSLGLNTQTE